MRFSQISFHFLMVVDEWELFENDLHFTVIPPLDNLQSLQI